MNSSCIRKSIILIFLSSSRDSKTQLQMLLLVSGRHVGAHLDGHQHGVASLYKSLQIWVKNFSASCCGLNLGESLCIFATFLFPDFGLNLLNSFDFYFDMG